MRILSNLNKSELIFVVLLLLTIQAYSNQVDSFNLLFPTSYHPIKGHARQIVTTSGGCYDWKSNQNAIVKVKGTHQGLQASQSVVKNQDCQSNGIIQLVKAGPYPATVQITAKERGSDEQITIPVRVRDLKRISIFTKSKIMNIKQIQNLEVYGFDSENNAFTSLEGLRFRWLISEINGRQSTGSIKKILLAQSSLYLPLDTRRKIQEQDAETDLLVVKGLKVGAVSVKVRCLEQNYQMISDEIILYIQQKFQIFPVFPVHLIAGSKFQYTLKSPTGEIIQLPSPYYELRLSDSSFQVNNKLQVKVPRKDAEATLTIIDKRTQPAFNQSIKIYSFQPDTLQILVAEQLIIGQEIPYEIKFNRNKQLLKGEFDPTLLTVRFIQQSSDSGDAKVFLLDRLKNKIQGYNKGSGVLKVQYNGLIAQKKIYSITPLKLLASSSKIVLPIGQIYQLTIVGGSGSYKYIYSPKTEEQSTLSISFNGLITTRKEGLSLITVVDEKNPNNRIQIQVYILKMGNIYSLEQYRQFNLNQDGSIYIRASPKSFKFSDGTLPKNSYFTQCNDALLRGLVFSPIKNSQSHQTPLKIITINPINDQTLRQIQSLAQVNHYISKLLKQGSQINQQDILKQFQIYVKYREIKSSQLNRLVNQMENYGLCAKVFVKAAIPFQGQVDIQRYRDENLDSHSSNLKLKVYERMINNIIGLELEAKEIVVAPLASFKWKTIGGPYSWNDDKIGNLQVYINNAKVESKRDQYPRITCSSSENDNIYTLKSQNPASYFLPRPVVQQKQIKVYCRTPDLLLVGLPLKYGSEESGQQTKNFAFSLSNIKKSTVYIYPGQCFRIFLQPVLEHSPLTFTQGNQQYTEFFNASNVKYQLIGAKYGKLEAIPKSIDETKPKSWNTMVLKYESKDQNSKDQLVDHITINAYQLQSKSDRSKRLSTPITFQIDIKTLKPLKLTKQFQMIDLPNNPSNPIKIYLQENTDPARFSLHYDQSVIKCVKAGNQITIIPQNVDRTEIRTIKVVDQFAIGRPSFQIPIKVSFINGVDLRVSRVERGNQLINKEKLESNIWLFDEEEFIAYVDVYTYNSSLTTLGKSPKQSINGIDPYSIQIKMQKINDQTIKQIERKYDPINNLILIRYKMPKIFSKAKINNEVSETQKIVHKLSAVIKSRFQQISSNSASLQIYNQISLSGFPLQQFSIKNIQNYLVRQILTIVHIMESCQTVIEIIGGPPHLDTKIQSNRGERQYFNIIKLNQRRYKIQTIKSTPEIMVDPSLISLTKKQDNLLSLVVSTNQNNPQLTIVYCLIIVVPIKNIRIEGLSSLLSGRKSRYLVQFGKNDVNNFGGNSYKVIQDKCSLKYLWKVSSLDGKESQVLILNSDYQKMGVNVTAVSVTDQQQLKRVTSNPISELSVKVLNKLDRQITDARKSITVLVQQQFPILTSPNPHQNKNQMITLTNTQVFLIPPHSSLQLSYNYVVEEMTPCSLEDPKLSIVKQNQIVTGQSNKIPELIKISYRQFGGSRQNLALPIFLPVLVTDICAVVIDNIDGAIAINPTVQNNAVNVIGSAAPEHLQLVRFNILDCIGRKFLHYNYKNIQYRVSVTSPNIATAKLYSVEEGLISLQGHQIGEAQVTLQVFLNGVLKAKDIMPINVNIFIRPSKPISVHLGDIINFKGPSSSASSTKWLSTDNRIIKINSKSGQAVAASEGQTHIQYGAMSTRVSVVKIVDIKEVDEKFIKSVEGAQYKNDNGYTYEIIYSGTVYGNSQDKQLVKQYLSWQCQVLGKQGEHLRGIIRKLSINNREYIRCYLQKKSGTSTLQTAISSLKILLTAQNKNIGFKINRSFEQNLQVFIILSQKYINPRDPKIKKQKDNYQIVVQTNQRLDVFQTGGKEHWIINNVFTGARQVITIDLTQYRGGEWRINLSNPRTKQMDYIIISHDKPEGILDQTSSSADKKTVSSGGWKWTDVLVVFMACNFLALVGYQIMKNSNSFHSKSL